MITAAVTRAQWLNVAARAAEFYPAAARADLADHIAALGEREDDTYLTNLALALRDASPASASHRPKEWN